MSQEIFYTSAPRGLKPGTRGFCTVVSTQGMSQPLAERLEALSGYRQLFAAHDPRASTNPVIYSHLLLNVGGRQHHVLSRIADAGLDYTQRSNKYAHHVALDPAELSPGGPAWTLSQPGFCEVGWNGEPKLLASGRRAPAGHAPAAICRHWQELTGDAGWGGLLAQTAAADPLRQAYILFRPGQDLLPLVAEALALLPERRRWQVTFSTWYTKLPAGIDCQWRFVLADAPEAKAIRNQQHALVIDLTTSLGTAAWSPLVEAARTGILQAPARPLPAAAGARPMLEAEEDDLQVAPPLAYASLLGAEYGIGPPPPPGAAGGFSPLRTAPKRGRTKKWLMWSIGASVLSLLLIGATVGGWLWWGKKPSAVARTPTQAETAATTEPLPKNAGDATDVRRSGGKATEENRSNVADPVNDQTVGDQESASLKHKKHDAGEEPRPSGDAADARIAQSKSPSDAEHGDDVNSGGEPAQPTPGGEQAATQLSANAEVATGEVGETSKPRLAQRRLPEDHSKDSVVIAADLVDAEACELRLLGWDAVASKGETITIKRADVNSKRWDVEIAVGEAVGPPSKIAKFYIEGKSLRFAWKKEDVSRHSCLRDCVLDVISKGGVEHYALRDPLLDSNATIDFTEVRRRLSLDLSGQPTSIKPDGLRLEVTLDEAGGAKVSNIPAKVDEYAEVSLPFEGLANVRVRIGLKYQPGGKVELDIANTASAAVWQAQSVAKPLSIRGANSIRSEYKDSVKPLLTKISKKETELVELGKNKGTPEQNKRIGELKGEIQGLTNKKDFAEREAGNWERLGTFLKGTHGKLRFSIYYEVDGHRVVLAETARKESP